MDPDAPAQPGVLISGRDPQWMAGLCWFLGICALLMGGLLALKARMIGPPALVMLSAAGGLLVIAFVTSVGLAGRRRYLRPTPTGFVYTTIGGERTFVDDDVMCVSLMSHDNFFGGNFRSTTRRFIMWIDTGGIPESIVCLTHLRLGQPDPLSELIVRIVRGLHVAAQDAHASGQRVEGDGWALEKSQLLLKSKHSTSVTSVNDLAAVDVVENQIRIWRRGEEQPIGHVNLKTANAHLLLLLLGELIPDQTPETEAELPPGSLGRLLFERGSGPTTHYLIGWLFAFILGMASVLLFAQAMGFVRRRQRIRMRTLATILGVASFIVGAILTQSKKGRFRRHVYGIQQDGLLGTRKLRFTEIGNMSYATTRNYVHGVYAGTTLILTFVPIPSTGLKPIRYGTTIKNIDTDLDKLRDDVSVVIAKRMHDFWSQNGFCPWMQFLNFAKDGLEYRPLTFTGRKQSKLIPYASIINFKIEDNMFRVWSLEENAPLVNEDTSQPNFYPGLVFLSELVQTFQVSKEQSL